MKTFESIYENGVLRPLEVLPLNDGQHVQVTIATDANLEFDASAYFDADDWEASKLDAISLEEVREALSSIQGSLADAVIASREERF